MTDVDYTTHQIRALKAQARRAAFKARGMCINHGKLPATHGGRCERCYHVHKRSA